MISLIKSANKGNIKSHKNRSCGKRRNERTAEIKVCYQEIVKLKYA